MALKVIRPEKQDRKVNKLSAAEKSERANRTILRRTMVLLILCGILAFIPLIATLYKLMIVDHDKYEAMAISNQTRSVKLTAHRGLIYDCNMNILASSKTVETVYISPYEIKEKMEDPKNSNLLDSIVRGLSEILDVDEEYIYKQSENVKSMYAVIKRKIPEELADEVRAFVDENDISGVYLETDAERYYPYSSLGAQLMGFVSSDNVGTEGLESIYDSTLQGTAGAIVTTKGNGTEMLYTYEKYYDAADGNSLVLTIDTAVQSYLEENLQKAVAKYDIRNGAFGIVMDVNTGDIKAMATIGSYDPNNHLEIYDEETAEQLETMYQEAVRFKKDSESYKTAIAEYNNAVAAARLKQWRNRCVSDGYEPGSTFKLVTIASALDAGAVTPESSFYCGGREKFEYRDQELDCWNHNGHGQETLEQALGNSCNIAFGHIGVSLGRERFYDYLTSFGFLEKTGIDLPGESVGYFYDPETWSISDLISASFGQTFRITPIQLTRAVAAIVNGGYLLEPHVVSEVIDAEGNVVQKNERTVLRQVISEETSATMREFMEFVVTDGTASNAHTPGYRVGGKTGTSEKIDEYDENGWPVRDKIVSFIGVAPINDPQYVVLVALDTPNYGDNDNYTVNGQYISGGLMGAPTVRDVFTDILGYLGVEPDYGSDDIRGVNITMPKLLDLTEQEAAEALKEKSLTYRVVGEGSVVTDTLPAAGEVVPGNSEVVLYMGAEKIVDMVEVPNFVGFSVADVRWLAEQAGLYIQSKGTDQTASYVGAAYQDVEAGTQVPRGSTITVEFASGGASD